MILLSWISHNEIARDEYLLETLQIFTHEFFLFTFHVFALKVNNVLIKSIIYILKLE